MTRLVFRPRPFLVVFFCALFFLAASQASAGQPPLRDHKQPSNSKPSTEPAAPAQEPPTTDRATTPPAEIAPPAVIFFPGPLRSLLRMAGVSQKAQPADVLPLIARNVYQHGFNGSVPSEYLKLLRRYIDQAKQLDALAGPKHQLRISGCDDSGKLLEALGYRLSNACGNKGLTLEVANPEHAFLTVDSGFPISDLEAAIQSNAPFVYAYPSQPLPLLFQPNDWLKLGSSERLRFSDPLDLLMSDPAVARLYWALSQMSAETANFLNVSFGLKRLLPVNSLLDLYGSQLSVRSNRVLVPGGTGAEPAWTSLVGANPNSPGLFVGRLLSEDNGWLITYFDVLSRVDPTEQQHLTEGSRLRRNYEAFRPTNKKEMAGGGIFRKATELLVLDSQISWEPNGNAHVPGSLDTWNKILQDRSNTPAVRTVVRRLHSITQPDQLIEALSAAGQDVTDHGPLQLYVTTSELDLKRGAANRLSPETVSLYAARFRAFHSWLLTFSEFPSLSDESIRSFLTIADSLGQIRNPSLQANALGSFQANVGLWQVLARQHQIPAETLNASWEATIDPFAKISSSAQLFDGGRRSLRAIIQAAGGDPTGSPDQIVDLLAGPHQTTPEGEAIHNMLRARMESVLEDQRLASLDTLWRLSDGLQSMEKGGKGSDQLVSLATELHDFELPRAIFTNSEKLTFAPAVYMNRHAELQTRTDLTNILKASATPVQLESARGQLAAFLRDTLVGLNYAYYEPPGAQILHINPLFVRAHDFESLSVIGSESIWESPSIFGAGVAAGGGAFLIGSLADLPFVLSSAEQDFIVPENIQSLVWRGVVPGLLTAATLPRWWDVTPNELHAVALYQRSGEEILTAAAGNPDLRAVVEDILRSQMSPRRFEELQSALKDKASLTAFLPNVMPSETFYLAEQLAASYPEQVTAGGPAGKELTDLTTRFPAETAPGRLSARFGVPHPVLAASDSPEILNLAPFPTSSGYTGRLFGESLESPNLYWARLADELGYPPVTLDVLVPELTRVMVSKIFASDMADYPAVIRAMRETGDDLRQGKITSLRKATIVSSFESSSVIAQAPQEAQ